jgi:hypothetical protein
MKWSRENRHRGLYVYYTSYQTYVFAFSATGEKLSEPSGNIRNRTPVNLLV